MLKQMEVFLIAAVFVLMTAIILSFYTVQREHEFADHHKAVQQSAVHGAAYAIQYQLVDKQRHLRLFLSEYQKAVTQLIRFPGDEKTKKEIKLRLQQRIPDFFTYTITDQKGTPIMEDIDSLVGKACQIDLNNYAQNLQRTNKPINNKIFIHPQSFHYHYDVMAPLLNGDKVSHIFFGSFYVKEIADDLKTHQTPGHKLLLVRQSDPSLIEVASIGTRDKLSREIHLSKEELRRIKAKEDIQGTDWRLVSLPDENYEKDYFKRLWTEAIIIMLIVTLALFTLITVLVKITRKRSA